MSNLSPIYIPAEGPKDAKIIVVGEAPGQDETDARRPFVGASGQFLERYLNRAGVSRNEVYLTNLCKHQPAGNKFSYCRNTDELSSGIDELQSDIREIAGNDGANIIIACGNWPLWYTTGLMADKKNAKPGTGISNWRGSVVPCSLVDGIKVMPTYHPAYIIRPNGFVNNPVFLLDLKRAVSESAYREIRPPVYDSFIDPPDLEPWIEELSNAEWLTVDIETFGSSLACVGFADGVHRGLCLTVHGKQNWEAAKQILASKAKKIFQYGTFDINYLHKIMGWEVANYSFDTYIAANNLRPGYPKGLAFLASIYTKFPYYKEDRKKWKTKMDLDILWEYNIKDVIATHTIAMAQMKELKWQ